MATNRVIPVFYRIEINNAIPLISPSAENDYGFIDDLHAAQYIENLNTGSPTGGQVPPPSSVQNARRHERGSIRFEKILENLSLNALPQFQLNIEKTQGNVNDPLNSEKSDIAFTIGYEKEETVYCNNFENVIGSNGSTEEIFTGEEAVNRLVARALAQTVSQNRYLISPTDFATSRTAVIEELTANALAPTLTDAQNAVNVTVVSL